MRCLCGCLSGARCTLFAYGPADATAIPKPHHLLPHLNPDWLYLSCTNLPRLSWKRGRLTGVIVVVVIYLFDQCGCYGGEWSTRPAGELQSIQVQLCHFLSVCLSANISLKLPVCVCDQCGCYNGERSTRPTGESQSTQVQLLHTCRGTR